VRSRVLFLVGLLSVLPLLPVTPARALDASGLPPRPPPLSQRGDIGALEFHKAVGITDSGVTTGNYTGVQLSRTDVKQWSRPAVGTPFCPNETYHFDSETIAFPTGGPGPYGAQWLELGTVHRLCRLTEDTVRNDMQYFGWTCHSALSTCGYVYLEPATEAPHTYRIELAIDGWRMIVDGVTKWRWSAFYFGPLGVASDVYYESYDINGVTARNVDTPIEAAQNGPFHPFEPDARGIWSRDLDMGADFFYAPSHFYFCQPPANPTTFSCWP
jgi:hypothetical protein